VKKTQIIIGLLIIIISCLSAVVYLASARQAVMAYLDKKLKITYNGNDYPITSTDGKECHPLIYQDQIYLPVNFFNGKGGLTINVDQNTTCVQSESESAPLFPGVVKKPNIYLYPTHQQEVTVKLTFAGSIAASYPAYNPQLGGWQVTAFPDGKIINKADHKEYSYLFWEGKDAGIKYDLSKGFVVAGKDTMNFLQETLAKLGLTPKEYNEFIVYWLPKMQNNKYNLITFAGKEYTDSAKLEIIPQPDALLRVFMAFKPLTNEIKIKAPEIRPFVRKGFTVVEWGGTELQ